MGGPILFLVYINDLPSVSNTLKTTLFADDTVVSLAHPNLTSLVMSVNSELNVFCDWFQNNRLSLNTTKTYAILCSASSIWGELPNLEMNGAVLPLTEQVKYSGIILDNQLSFKSHIDSIAKKISKLVGIFYKIKDYVPYHIMLQMYYTLIYPYLHYCVIVWGHTKKKVHINSLHLIQKKIVRIITGSSNLAHTNELFYKTQILKIQVLSKFSLSIYGYKLHMNDNLQ